MRVIVTGGAGFIGSALVRYLVLEKGYEVLNVDALTYAGYLPSLRRSRASRIIASSAPTSAIARRWRRRSDLQAAADHASRRRKPRRPVDHGRGRFHPDERHRNFHPARGGAGVLVGLSRIAKEQFRFLHVSTDEVYGSLGDEGLFTEETPYDPSSPYSASKASSDHLAKAWQRTYGLPVVVSNCSNNYGPYHFPEKLIPLTILNALAGERLPVYGKGENVRDWLYVEDHARALDMIIERGRVGETYNVGGRNERRNIDVVRRICAVLDELSPANGRAKNSSSSSLIGPDTMRDTRSTQRSLNGARLARPGEFRQRDREDRAMVSR